MLDPFDYSEGAIKDASSVCVHECPSEDEILTDASAAAQSGAGVICRYYGYSSHAFRANAPPVPGEGSSVKTFSTNWFPEKVQAAEDAITAVINTTASNEQALFVSELVSIAGVTDENDLDSMSTDELAGTVVLRHPLQRSTNTSFQEADCFGIGLPYTNVLNRCVPNIASDTTNQKIAAYSNATNSSSVSELRQAANSFTRRNDWLNEYANDLWRSWIIIAICGVGCAVLLSFVMVYLLRLIVGVVVWSAISMLNLLFAAIVLTCAVKADLLGDQSIEDQVPDSVSNTGVSKQHWEIATYVTAGLAFITLILSIVMIPRLRVAIATIRVAGRAIAAVPTIVFYPLVDVVIITAVVAWFITVAAYLYSTGEIEESENSNGKYTYEVQFSRTQQLLGVYHLFGLLWNVQIAQALGILTLAGTFASYYWASGRKANMPPTPVRTSFKNAFLLHLGTAAIGAFLIALLQLARIMCELVFRSAGGQAGEQNRLMRFIKRCIQCCLKCAETIVKFVNRNAFIIAATKNTGFCASASRAFALIVSNILGVAAVNVVGSVMVLVCKLTVTITCAAIAFVLVDEDFVGGFQTAKAGKNLQSDFIPVLASGLLALVVSTVFFNIYDVAIDTVFLSFLEDTEEHNGSPQYAPKVLLEAIGATNEQKAKVKSANEE